MDRPTFSPFWHRVRSLRARLRPHVQVTRQHYRGRRWHVVHDPATNQFFRLSPVAHALVGLLDGARTVEEAWKIVLANHGDEAPTQPEVIQLLSQLYQSNLISADASPETEQLLRRGRERKKKKAVQQAIGLMYFRMRLFNPDRILTWLEPILRPVLNRAGLIVWALFVAWALWQLVPHVDRLIGGFESALSPSNWGWLIVVFVVAKAVHETGHGVICKRFGGQVPEFGFMLLVLFPAPYVDASSAWAMDSKWRRISVGAGGMIFELFLAAIAAIVWVQTMNSGGLVHQVAYNMLLTASVSTVLFNANPLMRFDGYYILSDLLEVPNLMQRSNNQLKHFFQKHVYRLEQTQAPTTLQGERAILYVYGVLAFAYRLFLFITITLYVMGKLFVIGLLLAIWTGVMWFVLPVGKLVHWMAAGPQVAEKRGTVIATTLAMVAAGVLLIGAVPMPDRRKASGVIESLVRTGVFTEVDAFVVEAHVRPGQCVRAGDPILTGRSPELVLELAETQARVAEAEARARVAEQSSPSAGQVAFERVAALREQVRTLEERVEKLVVRAPADGVVVGGDPAMLVGAFIPRGRGVCEIVDPGSTRIAAVLTQDEAAWHFDLGDEGYKVEIRPWSRPSMVLRGEGVTVLPAAQARLPHASMTFAGGGRFENRPDDRSGLLARDPQFVMRVASYEAVNGEAWAGQPGERVTLRFTLPRRPLLWQWRDRLHKLVQGRIEL
ncbi:MAG: PqqD family peptide modification chaperone [Phycisphaerales bacterium]|nr:MAG: PqqD family peptide modification chaperone [Phycisphaerales bacterium]